MYESGMAVGGELALKVPTGIAVLEDEHDWRELIVNVIEDLGLKAYIVQSAREARLLAQEKKTGFYLFDAQIGDSRQEGLDALEYVKEEDPEMYVAVYSGHGKRLDLAKKLGADDCQSKSDDLVSDIHEIISRMFYHSAQVLKEASKVPHEAAERRLLKERNETEGPESDINYLCYMQMREDKEWLQEHEGSYIAIVKGKQVGGSTDMTKLLNEMQRQFPSEPVYFTKVEAQEKVMRMFSPSRARYE